MTIEEVVDILRRRNNNYAQRKGLTDYVRENEKIINAIIDFANERENRFMPARARDVFPFAAAEFSAFDAPITNTKPAAVWRLIDVYTFISKNADLKTNTDYLRSTGDKSIKANYLPYCCFSGTFHERAAQKLINHSGLLMIDFDHVGDLAAIHSLKSRLLKDRYFETLLMFRSPSGDGLKWLINIDVTRYPHRVWFDGIYNYVLNTYGLAIDKSGSDIARACFLCHDAQAFINPNIYRV
ncbi:MAG: virulence protein E [Paludibacter sp.]|nr:virulence protein E [Paludibacter sp.]